jgi:chorismate--pyruvate lyase
MSLNQRLLHSIPHWVKSDHASLLHLEQRVNGWLLDSSSLTQRIKDYCECHKLGSFRVRVINQSMAFPSHDERFRLNIKNRRYALIREVVLYCGDLPLIYARTVIPSATLTGPQKQLASLGAKPLGAFLFSQPELQRDAMEVVVLQPGQQLFDLAVKHSAHKAEHINARRSIFRLQNKPLLVAELFLPTLFA